MTQERQVFTLKQVAQSIQKIIAERYQSLYWVQAEVHRLNYTTKGHCYPELVQKENDTIVVDMRGTIWKSNYDKISKNFSEIVKEPLRDGMNLLLLVKISFHPLYGMGLEIIDVDPTYSLGELEKERKETLLRLQKEGILNANQQVRFPLLPKRIAIISVESSKGLSDFYSVINQKQWSYRFFLMLFEAQLNGDAAIESIQKQLKRIEKVKQHFDVVVIIRGGGGEIGLSCYNNYHLAKTIASFPLPVLTGIGHSTNITVSEMVAYHNAITPTELAEMLVQTFHEFAVSLENGKKILLREAGYLIEINKKELRNALRFVGKGSLSCISNQLNGLNIHGLKLKQYISSYLQTAGFLCQQLLDKLKNSEEQYLFRQALLISEQGKKLTSSIQQLTENQKNKLRIFEKTLALIDPKNILKMGYSITLINGKLISSKNPVKEGDLIETTTADFILQSELKKITENE